MTEIYRLPVSVRRLFYPEAAPDIRVVTCKILEQASEFARLRRTQWVDRRLLVSGKWRGSPNHQGNARFDIACASDHKTWALYDVAFPTRLVAIARADVSLSPEQAGAAVLAAWIRAGGVNLDFTFGFGGRLNVELFMKLLEAALK